MNAVEEIQAAIDKLTKLKAESTPGPWIDWHSNMDDSDGNHIPDDEMDPDDYEPFYCPPVTAVFLIDAHDRKTQEANANLIITLHATIDAQLLILRNGPNSDDDGPITEAGRAYDAVALILARAINGGTK